MCIRERDISFGMLTSPTWATFKTAVPMPVCSAKLIRKFWINSYIAQREDGGPHSCERIFGSSIRKLIKGIWSTTWCSKKESSKFKLMTLTCIAEWLKWPILSICGYWMRLYTSTLALPPRHPTLKFTIPLLLPKLSLPMRGSRIWMMLQLGINSSRINLKRWHSTIKSDSRSVKRDEN